VSHGHEDKILVTGATGYVGGRLVAELERRERRLRCLTRRPETLRPRVRETTEIAVGDVRDRGSLVDALSGVDVAIYLIHSMGRTDSYRAEDLAAAARFTSAARESGVQRIVYLGGLGRGEDLSPHLASRQEVGRTLREGGVPTVEFRSSVVIGSGSVSFEMIRALVDRLPAMITPRWVSTKTQPIAIEDVIAYLVAAAELPRLEESVVVEIGGPDRVSYGDLMREYARQRGLKRLMISVPVLTPHLSSLWLGLVTPVYAGIGRELLEGLRNETIADTALANELFPDVHPRGVREAITRALEHEDHEIAQTRWSDAKLPWRSVRSYGGTRFGTGTRLVDARSVDVGVSPGRAFAPIRRIGGKTGWYYGSGLWRLRGLLDLLIGGPGMRRGRRDPETLVPGDALDFWRVEAYEPDRLLRLRAEMLLPGRAWLQFEVRPNESGATIHQTALFDPMGIRGLAYWYGIWPIHQLVFARMISGIAAAASAEPPPSDDSLVSD
jgi:uncharacterized protein YbjT (DUF2867 family)